MKPLSASDLRRHHRSKVEVSEGSYERIPQKRRVAVEVVNIGKEAREVLVQRDTLEHCFISHF